MWPEALWVCSVLLLVVVVPLVALMLRRRWLTGQGGMFDCALQLFGREPGTGWSLGVARYRGEQLQWFRSFSLSMRPRVVLARGRTEYVGRRPAAGTETVVLFEHSTILTVRDTQTGKEHRLGMAVESAMALISWLESAPPGIYISYGGTD